MESIQAVDCIIDKLLSRFTTYSDTCSTALDATIAQVLQIKQELLADLVPESELSIHAVMLLESLVEKVNKATNQISSDHRDIHSAVSKCGREIDKHFNSNIGDAMSRQLHFETEPELRDKVNKLVAQHLLTQGHMEVAELLAQESNIKLDENYKKEFLEINNILDDMKQRDLSSALRWVSANQIRLRKMDSKLEFQLHRAYFIELLKNGSESQLEIIQYAKTFGQFAEKHAREIQVLMGALAYLHVGLEQSPYTKLLDPLEWVELAELLSHEACALMGLPVRSPLSLILHAGTVALPTLLNIKQVMQSQVKNAWSSSDELPIEIDLGDDCRFHSVFSCPILRQQSTEVNPPMRLVCGHVISRDAMHTLASGNKLKCPYCPIESTVNGAKRVYF